MVWFVSKMEATLLTKEALQRALSYDPETGIFRWKVSLRGHVRAGMVAGRPKPNGYISIKINQVDYYAHRLAHLYVTGEWPSCEIDHINRVRSDNRWANLRPATVNQQRGNTKMQSNNSAGFKGVSLHRKSGLWRARLSAKTIGYYRTPEDAAVAYRKAAQERFGEFACAG